MDTVLSVLCWKWGKLFGPEYVNVLRSMMARRLHLPHELVCVTDDSSGIDPRVRCMRLPDELSDTPRCIRRLRQYDGAWVRANVGERVLSIDLDVVLVGDVTPLFDRPDPLVCWQVGYRPGIYSGALVLMDAGALSDLWDAFWRHPEAYARLAQSVVYRLRGDRPWGDASDQAVLNYYVKKYDVWPTELRDEDGITTYVSGYQPQDPPMAALRPGVRIVVFGSANKAVLDEGRHAWVQEHWK